MNGLIHLADWIAAPGLIYSWAYWRTYESFFLLLVGTILNMYMCVDWYMDKSYSTVAHCFDIYMRTELVYVYRIDVGMTYIPCWFLYFGQDHEWALQPLLCFYTGLPCMIMLNAWEKSLLLELWWSTLCSTLVDNYSTLACYSVVRVPFVSSRILLWLCGGSTHRAFKGDKRLFLILWFQKEVQFSLGSLHVTY